MRLISVFLIYSFTFTFTCFRFSLPSTSRAVLVDVTKGSSARKLARAHNLLQQSSSQVCGVPAERRKRSLYKVGTENGGRRNDMKDPPNLPRFARVVALPSCSTSLDNDDAKKGG